jgi:ribosomal protein S12 methylthiotransferase
VQKTASPWTAEHWQEATYSVVTLGCPKNLVDSERMLGRLKLDGYRFVSEPEQADFVLINTCGFLRAARRESLDVIDEMLELKRQGILRGVIVTGCLAERDKTALLESRPGIDQLVGVFSREEISRAADRLMRGIDDERAVFRPAPSHPPVDGGRFRLTPSHVAYLKIAEGCDRLCTFCSIPAMRGKYASKPQDDVIAEAQELASAGTRELILVAQDLTYYGRDLDGGPGLASLLGRLEEVDGVEWIRLMYLYPEFISDELIDTVAVSHKVLPYIDLPLQHINDSVLRRMNRGVGRKDTEALLDRLRERIEDLVVRTTMIVGFPGETEGQFEELLEFVRRRRFPRLGVFNYSSEPDTPAARLDGRLPEDVKRSRRDRLMTAQQEIAFAWNEAQVGRRMDVLIDDCVPEEDNAYVGRTYADAPEIDGAVYVTGEGLAAGQIVSCEIVAARQYDLIGAAIAEPK